MRLKTEFKACTLGLSSGSPPKPAAPACVLANSVSSNVKELGRENSSVTFTPQVSSSSQACCLIGLVVYAVLFQSIESSRQLELSTS